MYGDNMYIKDLHLLQVNIQKDDNKVFEGIIEDAPEELREVEIKKNVFRWKNFNRKYIKNKPIITS